MGKLRVICAVLLAILLIVFGGNYFLELFELPAGEATPGERLLVSMHDGGLMAFIALSHVLVGVLLLIPRTRFAGALLQLPISLGIVAFHGTMLPEGTAVAAALLALNLGALLDPARIRALVAAPT